MKSSVGKSRNYFAISFVILLFCGIFAILFFVLYSNKTDRSQVEEEMEFEEQLSRRTRSIPFFPEINGWDLEILLPKLGLPDEYEWKATAGYSRVIDTNWDQYFNFHGETVEEGDRITLDSPVVEFNKNNRVLTSDTDILLTLSWAKIKGEGMRFLMNEFDFQIHRNVRADINKKKARANPLVGLKNDDVKNNPEEVKADEEKSEMEVGSEEKPLVITSGSLIVIGKQDKAIFEKNVVAKDENGTIWADRMVVYNYSKEEKEKNSELTGVKYIVCINNVRIDQDSKQAVCDIAIYDAVTNTITLLGDTRMYDSETKKIMPIEKVAELKNPKQLLYRDEEKETQVLAYQMTMNRETEVTTFEGETESVFYNPSKQSFWESAEGKKKQEEKKETSD